jgi:hypothetical protein
MRELETRNSKPGTCLLPAVSLPQSSDVGHVMLTMPGVEHQVLFQAHGAKFGMAKGALPVFRLERAQQANPAVMQGIQ